MRGCIHLVLFVTHQWSCLLSAFQAQEACSSAIEQYGNSDGGLSANAFCGVMLGRNRPFCLFTHMGVAKAVQACMVQGYAEFAIDEHLPAIHLWCRG